MVKQTVAGGEGGDTCASALIPLHLYSLKENG